MSTSEARIIANRANALKSTGPKTEAGKLQSRRNSLQHGLAGEGTVLLPGDEAKLLERRESWGRVLRPEDEVEGFLVEQAILHSVKLDRLTTVESALACESVERADREYEGRFLARIERVEAEVRDWERIEGVLLQRGTLGRDGLDVIYRLLKIEGPDDPRRSDLVALSRAASAELGGGDESSRQKARETLADLIGARLDERRRALGRLFEELEDPRGRALARAAAALDVGPIGQLTHRYQKSEELGLTRMLDQLDRRRRPGSKGDSADRGRTSRRATKSASESFQVPQTAKSSEQSSGMEKLGKLPNEPKDSRTEGRSAGSESLGKLLNEPNGSRTEGRSEGSGSLSKLPYEPKGLRMEGSEKLGKLPNEPNGSRMEGLKKLGKLPNEPNGLGMAERSDGSGNLGKLPNEHNRLGTAEGSDGSGGLGKIPNEPIHPQTEGQSARSGDLGKHSNEPKCLGMAEGSDGSGSLGKLPNEPNDPRTKGRSEGFGGLGKLPNEPNVGLIADRAWELGAMEGFSCSGLPSVTGA